MERHKIIDDVSKIKNKFLISFIYHREYKERTKQFIIYGPQSNFKLFKRKQLLFYSLHSTDGEIIIKYLIHKLSQVQMRR